MAQPGNFTPILLYGSSTPGNAPLAANLTNSATGSEIAINVADKNLFFKDSGGVVNTVPIRQSSTSSNGWLSSTDWNTFNGKQATLVSGTNIKTVGGVTLLGSGDVGTIGVGYGGTGLTSLTAGYIPYGNGTGAFSSLVIGATNTVMISSGSAPQWSSSLALSGTVTAPNLQGPAFSAYQSTAQATTSSSNTLIQFQTTTFDTASNFSSTTTFTPNVPGYYLVAANISMSFTSASPMVVSVTKNGATIVSTLALGTAFGLNAVAGILVYMNGTTDYLNAYVVQYTGLSQDISVGSFFQASMVRGL